MHLQRLLRPLAALAVILAIGLAGLTPAGAETGPMSAESDHARLDALGLDADLHARVKLSCDGHLGDEGPVVGCSWHRHHSDLDVRSWQLWNLQVAPETGVRNLVAEVGSDTTAFRDADVEAPAKYLYAVVGLNGEGDVVARSRVVAVRLGERPHRDIEHLRLDCVGSDTDGGPVIGCSWSGVEEAPAVEYRLFRVSKRHDRRHVVTTGVDVTEYRDDDVRYGVRYRYWVVGVDAHGNIVAASRSAVAGVEAPDREVDHELDRAVDKVRDADPKPDRELDADRHGDLPTDPPADRETDRRVDRHRDH